jgi:hypothetical protein
MRRHRLYVRSLAAWPLPRTKSARTSKLFPLASKVHLARVLFRQDYTLYYTRVQAGFDVIGAQFTRFSEQCGASGAEQAEAVLLPVEPGWRGSKNHDVLPSLDLRETSMSRASLFPDPDLPVVPAAVRAEPDLWIRRLVVVTERTAAAGVVRDVSFRRGLNIVRVEARPEGETRPIGHSVGKTLLARLIRYCLGEGYFAAPEVTSRIAGKLPDAFVLAELFVSGKPWVVARPLRDAPLNESWALPAEDWRAGLGETNRLRRYTQFLDALTQATAARLPELRLPMANHPARWLDVLAWLARDQECGYKHYNEWRDPDANSGTARLPRDDASLLLRWAMGLLDTREIDEVARRYRLLREQGDVRSEVERLSHILDSSRPALAARLGLREEDMTGELFSRRASEAIDVYIRRLQGTVEGFAEGRDLAALHDDAVRAAAAVAVAENELARLRGASSASDTGCPLEKKDCPRFTAAARHDEQVRELEVRCRALRESHRQAENRYAEERRRSQESVGGTLGEIGRWQLLAEQFQEYQQAQRSRDDGLARVEVLERQARESRERQEAARGERDRRHARLSEYFDWTLKRLVGRDAGGAIRLDARGLHPAPASSVAANGAAMSTLATVLGLDLACLTATIAGVGHLPAFLLHDSPKEADLEAVLYERIFTLALELERVYKGKPAAFQYIVTTTTPPPGEAARDPYIRLTLDARADDGVLLRMRF